jgi:hypothetical protein
LLLLLLLLLLLQVLLSPSQPVDRENRCACN